MEHSSSLKCTGCSRTLEVRLYSQKIRCIHCNALTPVPPNTFSGNCVPSNHHIVQGLPQENGKDIRVKCTSSVNKFKDKISRNHGDASLPKGDGATYVSLNHGDPYSYFGRKRAFLCGVSYKGEKYKLKGPVNDVTKMRKFLMDFFQYPKESILVFTEKEKEEKYIPTKKNIQKAFKWLVKDLRPGNSLVFYYSGHGLRQLDFNDDELDGFDETICPVDFKEAGMILDNEINDTIVRPIIQGVTLHAIVDSCHSGTILDLNYVYDKKRDDREKWLDNSPPSGANKRTSGGWAICLSACADKQIAADTNAFSKEMAGAMTSNLIAAVTRNPAITYGELLKDLKEAFERANGSHRISRMLRRVFRVNIVQDPQLSSSKDFDVYSQKFKL